MPQCENNSNNIEDLNNYENIWSIFSDISNSENQDIQDQYNTILNDCKDEIPSLKEDIIGNIIQESRDNHIYDTIKEVAPDISEAEKEELLTIFEGIVKKIMVDTHDGEYQNYPEDLVNDPALGFFIAIWRSGYLGEISNEIEGKTYEDMLMVARNIYFSNKIVSREIVELEYMAIQDAKNEYKDFPLFNNSDVIMAAHEENMTSSEGIQDEVFGKKATINAIREQGGFIPQENIFHPENNQESLLEAKNGTLNAIIQSESPTTFIFDGHGSSESIYFSDGELQTDNTVSQTDISVSISYQELAAAFIGKFKAGRMDQGDVIIIEACFSQNFLRNVYNEFVEYNKNNSQSPIPFPVLIGPSEYDQVSYSNFASQYGGNFLDKVIDLSSYKYLKSGTGIEDIINSEDISRLPKHTATIGDIIKNEYSSKKLGEYPTNPSVFVPTDDGKSIMQIR